MKELEYPFDSAFILRNKIRIKKFLLNEECARTTVRIAVLGGSTTHDICNILQLFLLNQGLEPIFYESEYNKYWEDAMFSNDKLRDFQPDLIYIHTSVKNITVKINDTDEAKDIEQKLEWQYQHFQEIWEKLRQNYQCPIIQNNFERPLIRLYGNKDISDIHGFSNFVFRLNNRFYKYAQSVTWLYINDIDYMACSYGLDRWNDMAAWYMYKYAMAVDAIPEYSYNLSNIIKSLYGKNKKVLAVDLDNTLWGGVISEDGLNGIELGQDSAAGEMYGEIQKYIKRQKEIGVILAINSKNDMSNVELAFSHSDMQLELNDFSAVNANWNNKAENIVDIATKLNLGLDSIVFIDDNPVERASVKEQFPIVAVPELAEPERYIKILNRAGFFEVTSLSEEDRNRTQMYQAVEEFKLESEKYTDYNEFLNNLHMEGIIQKISEENIQRIAQLTNKTNQFNLTTRRLTEDEIRSFMTDENYICLYGRLKDKFGDNGIVSVLIAKKEEKVIFIELFLMSCRVLKRGMEDAMMDKLFSILNSMECEKVIGVYYKTKKNEMVKNLYQDMGFVLQESTTDSKKFVINKTDYKERNKNIRVV
ncbi:MAG: HAD-IIIC family phosphatase [Lachnospiraceae bacterium]|nr:HAD-IIIC family phosphatase [Lachnospiraceae bacterium]